MEETIFCYALFSVSCWERPRRALRFIHICLHSWMGNQSCVIVCYKSQTLFSFSPSQFWHNREQGNLSRKICQEVKMMLGKRPKSGTLNSLHYWEQLCQVSSNVYKWEKTIEGALIASCQSSFYSFQACGQIGQAQPTFGGCCVSFCFAQWTCLWV